MPLRACAATAQMVLYTCEFCRRRSSNLVVRMPPIVRLAVAAGLGSGTEVASDLEFRRSARERSICSPPEPRASMHISSCAGGSSVTTNLLYTDRTYRTNCCSNLAKPGRLRDVGRDPPALRTSPFGASLRPFAVHRAVSRDDVRADLLDPIRDGRHIVGLRCRLVSGRATLLSGWVLCRGLGGVGSSV